MNMSAYMKNRRAQRRYELIQLLGGKCVVCSTEDALELDHIDPTTKAFTLSGCALDKAWSKVLEEVAKCQVLCSEHHREKTDAYYFSLVEHGSETMYVKYKCRCETCVEGYATKRKTYASRSLLA